MEFHPNTLKFIENWMKSVAKGNYTYPRPAVMTIRPLFQPNETFTQFTLEAFVDGQEMQGLTIVVPADLLKD